MIKHLLIGFAVGYAVKSTKKNSLTIAEKREYLKTVEGGKHNAIWESMTDSEIRDCYEFMVEYFQKGKLVPLSSPLSSRLQVISAKYQIFT
jgi:hypothetical protein